MKIYRKCDIDEKLDKMFISIKISYDISNNKLYILRTNKNIKQYFSLLHVTATVKNENKLIKDMEIKLMENLKVKVKNELDDYYPILLNMNIDVDEIKEQLKELNTFNPLNIDRNDKIKRILDNEKE